uniref:Reverse transcriptase Ty1/copia-type domain-containing protein n=1 Tax=Fagus sylvatica TaxID=28930 RepID=A0A2N9GU88_FAGSY
MKKNTQILFCAFFIVLVLLLLNISPMGLGPIFSSVSGTAQPPPQKPVACAAKKLILAEQTCCHPRFPATELRSQPLHPFERSREVDPTAARSQLVGSLVYLTVTRPDISYAVHIVSQFMAAPRSLHYAAVLRILRYLKGTLFHGLHFSSQSSLTLQAYSDADWAGDPTDRRSTTGYCFLLGDSLISWRSKKQSVVARSSTEAEYRALADTTAELLWLRWLLQDLGIDCSTAVPIHCDNRSAIQIAHNDVFHERTKHIEIDCHFVRHHLLQGTLQLRSVSSQDQLADIFTKPMPPGRFRDLISKLKLVSVHPT